MVVGDGFEPPNPKEQIYSLPRLASSLPNHINRNKFIVLIKYTILIFACQQLFFLFFIFLSNS